MNIAIKDETEERLRRAIADYRGIKEGNISRALEEAIEMWIDHVYRKMSGKTEIKWS